jgi:hypothetical protein
MSEKNNFNIVLSNLENHLYVASFEYNNPFELNEKANVRELFELQLISAISSKDDIAYLGEKEYMSRIIYKALSDSDLSKSDVKIILDATPFDDVDFSNRTYVLNKESEEIQFEFGIYEKKNDKEMEILDLGEFCEKYKISFMEKKKVVEDQDIFDSEPAVLTSALGMFLNASVLDSDMEIETNIKSVDLNEFKDSLNLKVKSIVEQVRNIADFNDELELLILLNKPEIKELFKEQFDFDYNTDTISFNLSNGARIEIRELTGEYNTLTEGEYLLNETFMIKGDKSYRLGIDEGVLEKEGCFNEYGLEPEYFFDGRLSEAIEGILSNITKVENKKVISKKIKR